MAQGGQKLSKDNLQTVYLEHEHISYSKFIEALVPAHASLEALQFY